MVCHVSWRGGHHKGARQRRAQPTIWRSLTLDLNIGKNIRVVERGRVSDSFMSPWGFGGSLSI